jgi:hypothetical protein
VSALLLLLVWGTGDCRAQGSTPAEPITVRIGGVTLRPGGFLDIIGESRTADTPDSISTNFGDIPLEATHGQSFGSLRNSRLQLRGDWGGEGLHFTGYLESDFLNFTPGESDYRWRQYWLRARFHGWEILGGQAWSLLRPNRKGFDSDRDLMNTDVIDAGYHVGLLGSRRRQVRLGRTFGDYRAVFAWETQGNFLAKVTADKGFGHVEAVAFTGHRGRRGVTIAAVLNVTSRLHFVTQEYWSKRAAFEALGVVRWGRTERRRFRDWSFRRRGTWKCIRTAAWCTRRTRRATGWCGSGPWGSTSAARFRQSGASCSSPVSIRRWTASCGPVEAVR